MAFQVPSIFTAVDAISAPMRKMGRSVSGFASKAVNAVDRVDRAAIRTLRSINSLTGGFGIFLGTAGALQVLGGAVNIIADYEQANANLAAVTQVTGKELQLLKDDSLALGASTKFTAAEVAGLQTELGKLGFTVPEILDTTSSVLNLAAATNTDLAQASVQVGAAIRAFQLDTSEAGRVTDVFAASISKSALDMVKLDVALSQVAPVANQFGFSIENTVALMGKLADAGFEASTIATSTRSIILNLADSSGKLAKALGQPARTLPDVTAAMIELRNRGIDLAEMLDLTDKRSVAAFANFLEGAEDINVLSSALDNAGGTAKRMADQQLNTLQGSLTILNSAYQGFILTQDKNNGQFLRSIRIIVDVTAEILNFASGTQKATDQLNSYQLMIRQVTERTIIVLKVLGFLAAAYLAVKTATFIATVVTGLYTTALKLQAIWQARSAILFAAQIITISAWNRVTKLATAVQYGLNLAMSLNPIGIVIAAIVALIAVVVVIIKYWEDWGAALSLVFGPLGFIISLVQSFRRHWDLVTAAFENRGIINGLKAIGLVIIDALLMPMEQLLGIFAKIPGFDVGFRQIQAARQLLQRNLEITAGMPDTSLPAGQTDVPFAPENMQVQRTTPPEIINNNQVFNNEQRENQEELLQKMTEQNSLLAQIAGNTGNTKEGGQTESGPSPIDINIQRGFAF